MDDGSRAYFGTIGNSMSGFDVEGRNVSEDMKPGLDLRNSRIYERLCTVLDALLFYIPVFTSPVTRSSISLSVRPIKFGTYNQH